MAGFSAGEAEGLRRAMSRKRSRRRSPPTRSDSSPAAASEIERDSRRACLRAGARLLGLRPQVARRRLRPARLPVDLAAVHYGPEFLCALFNEQPMGFYPPDALAHEAQRRGIEVRGADVNASGVECSVEPLLVRIGLGYIKGLGEDEARALVQERERGGAYSDLADLASRSGIGCDGLERLAWSGRASRWDAGGGARRGARSCGGRGSPAAVTARAGARPARASPCRRRPTCARSTRGSGSSPTTRAPASPSASTRWRSAPGAGVGHGAKRGPPVLADRSPIALAGLARQRPATAKGVVFMLLEDEGGVANVIVRRRSTSAAGWRCARRHPRLQRGRLERREGVINVVAASIEALRRPIAPPRPCARSSQSRDAIPAATRSSAGASSPPSRLGPTASAGVAEAPARRPERRAFRPRSNLVSPP